ncbi:MAG: NHL repeat-containing protein [Candidatus Saccharimonadales bacterium]
MKIKALKTKVATLLKFGITGVVLSLLAAHQTLPVEAYYSNGQPASGVVGQTDKDGVGIYSSATVNNPTNVGMNGVAGVSLDTTRHLAYIADTNNSRVMVYNLEVDNSFSDYKADYVIGQSDFSNTRQNRGAGSLANNSLSMPTRVVVEQSTGNVYVADTGNNRVLIFATVITNDPDALRVIGAANFTSSNSSGTVSQGTMLSPVGIAIYGSGSSTKVYIADRDFNRVMVFGQITSDGQNAQYVIGQSDFISSTSGLSQTALAGPHDVDVDSSGKIFVTDTGNNRIMVWNSAISGNGQSANVVLGQTWFYSNSEGVSATALNKPRGVSVDGGGRLLVSDSGNNRVLIWTSVTTSAQAANNVVGQSNFTSNSS